MKAIAVLAVVLLAGCIGQPESGFVLEQPLNGSELNVTIDESTGMSSVKTYVFLGAGDSMKPALDDGKEYLCVQQQDYDVGQIVAYKGSLELLRQPTSKQLEKGYALVAHRIIGKQNGYYRIKGDNNRVVDTVDLQGIFCRIIINRQDNTGI